MKKSMVVLIVIVAVVGIGGYAYRNYRRNQEMLNPKFYSGNGRLEATEIYVSSKLAGRIEEIFVKEGDLVKKGDKLVRMQTSTLEAQKAGTLAKIKVQEGELAMAQATVTHRESAFTGAEKEFKRQSTLISSKAVSQREYDAAETRFN
ncbi:MAG TPA: biotin/lipoyl-binding protein, partial [Lentisphaeria bacterium]|nr:biotin/lipoyl-binding protein [Lentisphaeria bacterium]